MAIKIRVRFAPSPNGYLHLGHAYSALFSAQAARQLDGEFLLRIEDIDWARCKPEYTGQIFDDLAWLGLKWPEPVRRQSAHLPAYTTALDRLDRLRLLYPCFCTRKKLNTANTAKDPDGAPVYPGTCRLLTARDRMRRMTAGEPYAMRLDMKKAIMAGGPGVTFEERGEDVLERGRFVEITPQAWGDVVLARKDIGTSYHISVVVDDAVQSITHVTRGLDLYHATSIHRLLQVVLELPAPVYCHHRLIDDDTGRKLSKSAGDRSLRSLREAGVGADDVQAALGFATGVSANG